MCQVVLQRLLQVARLPYELYYFWEEVMANESQVLMSHWKYGKKGPPAAATGSRRVIHLCDWTTATLPAKM